MKKIINILTNKKVVNSQQVNDRIAITVNAIIDFNLTSDGRYIQGDDRNARVD